jgi:oligoribonuclease (3'-5' exoribonuclease)
LAEFAFAFMDCEFGGLDPELHDITEVAVIVTDYRLVELAKGEWRVKARPDRITKEAAAIFGYDKELWAKAPAIREVLQGVTDLMPKGKTVVPAGQNVRMDVNFLQRAWKSCDMPYPFDYHVIDLASLYYSWSLVAGVTFQSLSVLLAATTAGIMVGGTPHRAMADTRLTLDTFRHYIGRLAPREPSEVPPAAPAETSDSGSN